MVEKEKETQAQLRASALELERLKKKADDEKLGFTPEIRKLMQTVRRIEEEGEIMRAQTQAYKLEANKLQQEKKKMESQQWELHTAVRALRLGG